MKLPRSGFVQRILLFILSGGDESTYPRFTSTLTAHELDELYGLDLLREHRFFRRFRAAWSDEHRPGIFEGKTELLVSILRYLLLYVAAPNVLSSAWLGGGTHLYNRLHAPH